jgi:aminoglycoside 3-N-acetyltransferase
MREVTLQQVMDSLQTMGIRAGDGLLVHSAIQFLGHPVGGTGLYLEAIQHVVSPQGTIAVPTFNFAFARGERYDPQNTPSQGMGVFSEYIRQQPAARRTTHPMQSLAVIGRYTHELARLDTPGAFDDGSAFDRMLQLDFKLLLLGADIQYAAMVHYSEQRANVPYRYWKDFTGEILIANGWQTRTYRMFVRDLQIDPYLVLRPIQEVLEARQQWASQPLNYGQIAACRLQDFVAATDHLLAQNPWVLVQNPPLSHNS